MKFVIIFIGKILLLHICCRFSPFVHHIFSILKEATDRVKDQYTTVGELEKSIPSKPHVFLEIFESARIKSSQHGHELSDQSHLNVELNRLLNMNDPSSRKHINISPEDVFPLDRY